MSGPDFEPWVLARRAALHRTAWLLVGEEHLADDLLQTALVRVWPHWPRVREMADIDAYVRRVLTNTYLSWWRRRWRGEVPTGELPERAAVEAPAADRDLLSALARLPRHQRAVVVLRFAEDLSEAQTALLLGCSVGTVKSQAARALRTLRADDTLVREDTL